MRLRYAARPRRAARVRGCAGARLGAGTHVHPADLHVLPRPPLFARARAGGSIPRHILIELEKMKIVEKAESGKGGRRITETGQRDLDSIAGQIKAAEN